MKQSVKTIAAVLFLLVTTMSTSFAQDSKSKDLNPWTDCGIGAMIFTNTAWAAAISNVIWDLGTTAVTSNVSSQNTCSSSKASKVAMLIGTSYANLEDETVQGGGQHINAMMTVLSCEPSSQAKIIQSLKEDFTQSLQSTENVALTEQAKAGAYYNMVQAKVNGQFASQCHSL
jgi:hypothetical protein